MRRAASPHRQMSSSGLPALGLVPRVPRTHPAAIQDAHWLAARLSRTSAHEPAAPWALGPSPRVTPNMRSRSTHALPLSSRASAGQGDRARRHAYSRARLPAPNVIPAPLVRARTSGNRPGPRRASTNCAGVASTAATATNTFGLAALRPEGLRHFLLFPLPEAGAERQEPYRLNLGMRRLPPHAHRMDCRPPVPGHPRPGESQRTNRWQQTRHGFADVSCPFEAPGPFANDQLSSTPCFVGPG